MSTQYTPNLGSDCDSAAARDAVHVAVAPAVAGRDLAVGERVRLGEDGKAWPCEDDAIGIVDPFRRYGVEEGSHFWLCLFPGTVTGLRHAWTHPAMPEGPVSRKTHTQEESEAWLREFINKSDCPDYHTVIGAAVNHPGGSWDNEYLHFSGQDAHGDIPPEFWDHVENVTGQSVPPNVRAKSFSCSC